MAPEPEIDEKAIEERFLAGSGPGGQNANKVATAVQLKIDIAALGLAPPARRRLERLAGSRLTGTGELVVTARTHRTREANRAEARRRLAKLIARAHMRPKRRRPTKPSAAARARRVEAKKQRGAVKKARARPPVE
ncbi:MAG: alternative ribosome rescue aminoacyl-tRNA hydrolase ArfB [Sphingomonadaceae bacterium]